MFQRLLLRFRLVTVREYCDAVEAAFDRGYRLGTAWGQNEGREWVTTYMSPDGWADGYWSSEGDAHGERMRSAEALAEEAVASACRCGCGQGPSEPCLWI